MNEKLEKLNQEIEKTGKEAAQTLDGEIRKLKADALEREEEAVELVISRAV